MVIWSIRARNDLKQIYDYIAKDSRYYATNVVENIVSKAEHRLINIVHTGLQIEKA